MTFSVMIVTRNRCESLQRTLRHLEGMTPAPDEIIVCADACTDDTEPWVSENCPQVRLFSNPTPLGSVGSRERMLREATGDWVLSIDDDSYPISPDFFSKAADVIRHHPEAAVICFPELLDENVYADPSQTPSSRPRYVAAYANCAGLMNLAFYRRQPGFPPFFTHMYEEPDYSLQCYAGGRAVWFEPSLPFRHHRTMTDRKWIGRHHSNARNELWSAWMRCPGILLPLVVPFRMARQFQAAFRESPSWIFREPQWWWSCLRGLPECLRRRRPVPLRIYMAWMKLPRWHSHTPTDLGSVLPFQSNCETTSSNARRAQHNTGVEDESEFPRATVVITTKNRKDDLRRAIESCLIQKPPVHVLVVDDASVDQTYEMVREEFPTVQIERSLHSHGYIVQRNFAARIAPTEYIVSIDDDAEFSSPSVVAQAISHFRSPDVAAVAIPFIDVNRSPKVRQLAPTETDVWATNEFIGTAHALRRSAFWEVNGYREHLIHQGEEGDLTIRLMDRGYYIICGSGDPILHHESPNRNLRRINELGQRNLLIFTWQNVPMPELIPHLIGTLLKGLSWGWKNGVFWFRLRGAVKGLIQLATNPPRRSPVSRSTYWRYRQVKHGGPVRVNQNKAPS